MGKICSYLTMMTRIDRFSPRGLLGILEDGTAERVVRRAELLTFRRPSASMDCE